MNDRIEILWTNFSKGLKRFILKKVKEEAVAEDILQEIFLKILAHPEKLEQAKSIRPYLYVMARHATYDYFRQANSYVSVEAMTELWSEEEIVSLNATLADCCLKAFIQQLPEPYREAVLRVEIEGISQKALAEKTEISYSGAKSRVQRGREKLKELILACCAYRSDVYGNLQAPNQEGCRC